MKILFAKKKIEELEKIFQTNVNVGLKTSIDQKKKIQKGKNKIENSIKTSYWFKLKKQIQNFLVFILLLLALITFTIGYITQNKNEIFEGSLILLIIICNALVGVICETKAEKASTAIIQKTLPFVKIIRDNQIQSIMIENLVEGDIVFLETGNIVPADIRLIENYNLQIDESILTGENIPVNKNNDTINQNESEILNCNNLVFKDTLVIYGKAKGLVIAVGIETEIGKIIKLIKKTKKETTVLEKDINKLGKMLTILIFFIILLNTCIILIKNHYNKGLNLNIIKQTFLISISLAVAVIPEGILTIITIILTLGIKKLLDKKIIIKNVKCLETLGQTKIICTDKTGTLTENKLNIESLYLYKNHILINQKNFLNKNLTKILTYGILCNSIEYDNQKKNKNKIYLNNPIDQSFINLSINLNYNIPNIRKKNIKIFELPFDSDRKLMTTIHQNNKEIFAITKGAPEILFKKCQYIENKEKIIKKTKSNLKIFEDHLQQMSQKSLRILGISYKKLSSGFNYNNPKDIKNIEKNLIFLGLISIKDKIKKNAFKTIKILQKANISTIMITGDNLNTATAIATELKIFNKQKDLTMTGEMLNKITTTELINKIDNIKVYARTNPIHKLKIINAWQQKGLIVTMIGDGVNDAPSIKKANVGISMGKKGTEISKIAADIIITDDNILTITQAVQEGQNIFDNIQKSLIFLLSCNIGEILAILLNTCLNNFIFSTNLILLNASQILWINLITDSLIAIALGIENKKNSSNIKKSTNTKKNILNKNMYWKIILEGIMIGTLTFIAAIIGFYTNKKPNISIIQREKYAQTFAFMVLSLSQLMHVFNLVDFKKSIFITKPSKFLIQIFLISAILQISTIILPFLKNAFHLVNLNLEDFILIILLSIMPIIIIEIFKKIKFKLIK